MCLVARWCSQQWVCLLLLGKSLKVRSQIPNGFHKSAFCFLLRSLDDDGGSSTHWDRSPKMSPPFLNIGVLEKIRGNFCIFIMFFDLKNKYFQTDLQSHLKYFQILRIFLWNKISNRKLSSITVLQYFKIEAFSEHIPQCDSNSYSEQFKATYYIWFLSRSFLTNQSFLCKNCNKYQNS